ncbi:pyridoxamine 5'-phosphate oxidase family protein [Teichococcus vastitatis]|jgi:general stress protein 26|uniref:Pyridoxamine 5'-phosphate oxidase family protein n=1 Tax=Teichococcus vastitatis TaxID=2307076 RepID=A0ABS9W5Y5_9PROT|nr:pyridoxamine 5'-phosphate oxidase family protein [Pseudoroseomonas vastitatis]MCI0754633.1 pyridoxamine 5'-phosphate oxidase family protein [Pseudoroseomonas vastitatis]
MQTTRNDDEMRIKVRDMIAEIGTAIFTTIDGEGHLRGRPMRTQKPDPDGKTLWFFTRADSPKVAEIQNDPRVLLGYSDTRNQDYVSISGKARLVTDTARKQALWTEGLRTWLPEGAESPEVALIAVTIDGAEYWDGISSSLRFAYGYAQSLVTGRPDTSGENAKVNFT